MLRGHARITLAFLLFTLLPFILFASDFRIWDPDDGLALRQAYNFDWNGCSATDEEGNICVVWSDTRLEDRDIFAQLFSADGTALWGEKGKLIVGEFSSQEKPSIVYVGNGSWIVTWMDFRSDPLNMAHGDIYMQKIDQDGNTVWNESGSLVCESDQNYQCISPISISDNFGGAYTFFVKKTDSQAYIFGQHVDCDGDIAWRDGGFCMSSSLMLTSVFSSYEFSIINDEDGDLILVWIDNRNTTANTIYGNKINSDAELIWADTSGVLICGVNSGKRDIEIASDGNDGVFLTWSDIRNSMSSKTYAQHLNSDAELSWDIAGVTVFSNAGRQTKPQMIKSGQNETIISCTIDDTEEDVFIQKISNNEGNIQYLWGDQGIQVSATTDQPDVASLASDLNGGAYITWVDDLQDIANDKRLFLQHYNQDGTPSWNSTQGLTISNRSLFKQSPIVLPFNNEHAGVFWKDYINGLPSLMYQVIDGDDGICLQEGGEEIVSGYNRNVENPCIVPSSDNTYFLVWQDERLGILGNYPYMHRLNGNYGDFLNEPNGIPVFPGYPINDTDTTYSDIYLYKSKCDNLGNLFSIYVRGSENKMILQKTDPAGFALWGDRGQTVSLPPNGNLDNHCMIPFGNGEAIIAYSMRYANDNRIYIQRLNENGVGQWPGPNGIGNLVITDQASFFVYSMEIFNDSSILIVYENDNELYAQRVLPDGENAWEEPVVICNSEGVQVYSNILKINDNILVTWIDYRLREDDFQNICGQVITEEGEVVFIQNGLTMLGDVEYNVEDISFVKTSDGFWMIWQDSRDTHNPHIYIQKYSNNLEQQLLPENGIPINSDDISQFSPVSVGDGDDGLYVIWRQRNDPIGYGLYYTHFNEEGNYTSDDYSEGYLPLSTAYNYRDDVDAVSDGQGGFIAVWKDNRKNGSTYTSTEIYIQRVNDWTVSVENTPDVIPEGWSLENAYPNPFNPSTRIAFNVGHAANVTLTVYDILGREVIKLVDGRREAGNHIINWNGTNATGSGVASGTYFYRLESDEVMITKKMILMK